MNSIKQTCYKNHIQVRSHKTRSLHNALWSERIPHPQSMKWSNECRVTTLVSTRTDAGDHSLGSIFTTVMRRCCFNLERKQWVWNVEIRRAVAKIFRNAADHQSLTWAPRADCSRLQGSKHVNPNWQNKQTQQLLFAQHWWWRRRWSREFILWQCIIS